jgi:hypothetical protein
MTENNGKNDDYWVIRRETPKLVMQEYGGPSTTIRASA